MFKNIIFKLTLLLLVFTLCTSTNVDAQAKRKKQSTTKKRSAKRTYGSTYSSSNNGGETYNGHEVFTGPRGGKYYINGNGNKTYIKH